jgi:amino-acid N-acetyltransferase
MTNATSTALGRDARLRPATPNDLRAMEELLTASGLPTAGVADALPSFTVAVSGENVVGVAGLEVCRDNALLRSVAVAPEWRSQGLGRALVTHVIANAHARGLNALYLLTTTAEHYFPSFGFAPITRDEVPAEIKETWEFKGGCCETATVMCRHCGN